MKIIDKKTTGLKHEIKVAIPAAEYAKAFEQKLNDVAAKIKKPGFRPGKVPLMVIKREHGAEVEQEVMEALISKSVDDLLKAEKIRAAMPGQIQDFSKEEGKDITYTFVVESLPEVKPADLKAIAVDKITAEADDALVQKKLQEYADHCVHFHPLKKARAAKATDLVKAEYSLVVDGNAFRNAQVFTSQFIVGEAPQGPRQPVVEALQTIIAGMKAGDEGTVDITFPENIQEAELKGKKAIVKAKLVEVQEREAHKVDDELAKHFGLENLEALKQMASNDAASQLNHATRTILKRQILDQLDKANAFDLPEGLLERETQVVMQEAAKEEEIPAEGSKERKKFDEEIAALTKRRVRLGLILAEIGAANKIVVTDEELRMALFMKARAYPGKEKEVVQFYLQNPEAMATVKAPILEEKIIDYIMSVAKVAEKKVAIAELLKAEQDALEGDDEAAETKPKAAKPKKAAAGA